MTGTQTLDRLNEALGGQPHAQVVLGSALTTGSPSHAYLFHGPSGAGKVAAARAFAAELIAGDSGDRERDSKVRARVERGVHPDVTWITPSGAHKTLVDDIAEPVLRAATLTPFESDRRAFVLEQAETLGRDVANRLLKTLEEPAPWVHFVLLTETLGQVLPTVVSRCQIVRFDPEAPGRLAARLAANGVPADTAASCAALAGGNAGLAERLASDEGLALRTESGRIVSCALRKNSRLERPWQPIVDRAEAVGKSVEAEIVERGAERVELAAKGRERDQIAKAIEQTAHRAGRRARREELEHALQLTALLLRDLAVTAAGDHDLILAQDRRDPITKAAADRRPGPMLAAIDQVEETRRQLRQNVVEPLALEALSYRLEELLAA